MRCPLSVIFPSQVRWMYFIAKNVHKFSKTETKMLHIYAVYDKVSHSSVRGIQFIAHFSQMFPYIQTACNPKKRSRLRIRFLEILPQVFSSKSSFSSLPGQSIKSFYSAWYKHYCLQASSRNGNAVRDSEKSSSTSFVFSHNEGSSAFLLQTFSFQRSQESRDRKDTSSCQNQHELPIAHIRVPVTKPTATMPSFSMPSPESGLKCFTLLLEKHIQLIKQEAKLEYGSFVLWSSLRLFGNECLNFLGKF